MGTTTKVFLGIKKNFGLKKNCSGENVRIDGLNKRGGGGELFVKDFRKRLIKNEPLSNNHR